MFVISLRNKLTQIIIDQLEDNENQLCNWKFSSVNKSSLKKITLILVYWGARECSCLLFVQLSRLYKGKENED